MRTTNLSGCLSTTYQILGITLLLVGANRCNYDGSHARRKDRVPILFYAVRLLDYAGQSWDRRHTTMTDEELKAALENALERIESLERRVSALEANQSEQDTSPTPNTTTATSGRLDHYDRAVVDGLPEGYTTAKIDIVQRYLEHSQISRRKTAKKRTKQLLASDLFDVSGDRVTYTGAE